MGKKSPEISSENYEISGWGGEAGEVLKVLTEALKKRGGISTYETFKSKTGDLITRIYSPPHPDEGRRPGQAKRLFAVIVFRSHPENPQEKEVLRLGSRDSVFRSNPKIGELRETLKKQLKKPAGGSISLKFVTDERFFPAGEETELVASGEVRSFSDLLRDQPESRLPVLVRGEETDPETGMNFSIVKIGEEKLIPLSEIPKIIRVVEEMTRGKILTAFGSVLEKEGDLLKKKIEAVELGPDTPPKPKGIIIESEERSSPQGTERRENLRSENFPFEIRYTPENIPVVFVREGKKVPPSTFIAGPASAYLLGPGEPLPEGENLRELELNQTYCCLGKARSKWEALIFSPVFSPDGCKVGQLFEIENLLPNYHFREQDLPAVIVIRRDPLQAEVVLENEKAWIGQSSEGEKRVVRGGGKVSLFSDEQNPPPSQKFERVISVSPVKGRRKGDSLWKKIKRLLK